MTPAARVSVAARVFTLAAVGSICVVRDLGFQGLGLVLVVALVAESLPLTTSLHPGHVAVLEGGLAALAVVAAHPANDATFPYLAIPALVAGLHRGLRCSLAVLLVEALSIGLLAWLWIDGYDAQLTASVVTWLITGLGLGYLGSYVRGTLVLSGVDASYRDALDLIKQLHALSGRLESGLDPVSIAEQLMAHVSGAVMTRQSVVLLRSEHGGYSPLRYGEGAQPGTFGDVDALLDQCWADQQPVADGRLIAVPLATDRQMVAVLLSESDAPVSSRELRALGDVLMPEAVRLHAALLFTDVREAATSEERQRLAREVHDGVAQDVASLGYQVDSLLDVFPEGEHAAQLARLRGEVSRVVAELRNSVFDLRNEVGAGHGLGQSIAGFARHVGSHSPFTVHVTLAEASARLRPQVEAELLRIAQEAINNARRHSGAANLWVSVEVRPPFAQIEVTDDGSGLGAGREDSHGLRIMRERADRIGADLELLSPVRDGRGTRLSVRLTRVSVSGDKVGPATSPA